MQGVVTFRAFGWVPNGIARDDQLLDDSQRPWWALQLMQRYLQFVLQLLVALLADVVVALATRMRSWSYSIDADGSGGNTDCTGASLVTLMTFGTALADFVRTFTTVEISIGAVSKLKTFGETVKLENRPNENAVTPAEWPMRGNIEIIGVSASYDGNNVTQSRPKRLALRDLHLSITAGEEIAICGRSGR